MMAAHGRLLLLLALTACSSLPWRREAKESTPATTAEVDERIRRLVNLKGEYWFGDAVFSLGDNEVPINAIAAADTIGIRSLVACLSDERRTHVTLHGQRVTVGRLCAEALVRTAYVRSGFERHLFPEGWRGWPETYKDSLDLGPAQRWWLQWLRERQLVWPPLPPSPPACPAPGTNTVVRSTPRATPVETPRADGRIVIHWREDFPHYRFTTFVVDSEFVILSDALADSTHSSVLEDLSLDDIASITVEKPESEAWKWRACEGVPLVLIVTKSRSWRPRQSH
jgi:hypothetical protein